MVYRAVLPDGQVVAVKRAKKVVQPCVSCQLFMFLSLYLFQFRFFMIIIRAKLDCSNGFFLLICLATRIKFF